VRRILTRIALAASILVPTAGCPGPGLNFQYYSSLHDTVASGDVKSALAKVEKSKDLYGKKSELLWQMDHAMLTHLDGRFEDSNGHIAAAEKILEDLYTRSVSKEAASFLTSDASLPYPGEDFEKVFLNVLGALNYSALGLRDEAVVEAKRADLKLNEIARVHPDASYREDPFVRLLMGLVYEDAGELNDAWISYAKALQVYERQSESFGVTIPSLLLDRAALSATRLGFQEELGGLKQKYTDRIVPRPIPEGLGRVVLVQLAGVVPLKVEERVEITLGNGLAFVQAMEVSSKDESDVSSALTVAKTVAAEENIVFAFPKMKARMPSEPELDVWVDAPVQARAASELVLNLGMIAPKSLDERMGRIWAKLVARVVVRWLLAYAAGKAGEAAGGKDYGALTGLLARVTVGAALGAFEHADTRSWGTLPLQVRLAVLEVPPGTYDVSAGRGTTALMQWSGVQVEKGRSTFLVARTR
jgi:hypothetical protein